MKESSKHETQIKKSRYNNDDNEVDDQESIVSLSEKYFLTCFMSIGAVMKTLTIQINCQIWRCERQRERSLIKDLSIIIKSMMKIR